MAEPISVARGTDAPAERWLVVNGGLHRRGGMDRANAALVDWLLAHEATVDVVAHVVDEAYRRVRGLTIHEVPRPAGSVALGEWPLERRAHAVLSVLRRGPARVRVVANGGNMQSPDVNWVHSVHAAWPCVDDGAPLWFRAKNRIAKTIARTRERRALHAARYVVANSRRTAADVISLGIGADRVRTVYLGADATRVPASPSERQAAQRALGVDGARRVAVFVGALSHDNNKGLDVLLKAWGGHVAGAGRGDVLLVAGGGSGVPRWERSVRGAGIGDSVRLLGFTDRVDELLAAADLLVSPVRYEAYGLNVQEALCRGVAVLVSASAGITERIATAAPEMVLAPSPDPAASLGEALASWSATPDAWRSLASRVGERLRAYTWDDMAADLVASVEGGVGRRPAEAPRFR